MEKKANIIRGHKYITIHHSAVSPGASNLSVLKQRARSYERSHKNRAVAKSWPSKTDGKYGFFWISYHYLISKNGDVLQVQNTKFQRIHATDSGRGSKSHNLHGIAICFDGNYQNEAVTQKQIEAAGKLIYDLEKKYKVSFIVRGHKQTALLATSCPGVNMGDNRSGAIHKIIKFTNSYEVKMGGHRHDAARDIVEYVSSYKLAPPPQSKPVPKPAPPKPVPVVLPGREGVEDDAGRPEPAVDSLREFLFKKLTSRKFLVAVLAFLVPVLNRVFDLDFSTDEIWLWITPLLAYLGVEGLRDVSKV